MEKMEKILINDFAVHDNVFNYEYVYDYNITHKSTFNNFLLIFTVFLVQYV